MSHHPQRFFPCHDACFGNDQYPAGVEDGEKLFGNGFGRTKLLEVLLFERGKHPNRNVLLGRFLHQDCSGQRRHSGEKFEELALEDRFHHSPTVQERARHGQSLTGEGNGLDPVLPQVKRRLRPFLGT